MSKKLIDGKNAKGTIYMTDILDNYSGFSLQEIELTNSKRRYKVLTKKTKFELRIAVCGGKNSKERAHAKEEYENFKRIANTESCLLKPLDIKESYDKRYGEYHIEALYEINDKTLMRELQTEDKEKTDGKRALDITIQTLEILKDKTPGSCPTMRLDNILLKRGRIEFLNTEEQIDKLKSIKDKDYSNLYNPPEVLRSDSINLEKLNVYEWGMMIYHFIGRKSTEILEFELEYLKREKGMYGKFIDHVKKIELANDFDGKIAEMLKNVLLRALDEGTDNRPSFSELYELVKKFCKVSLFILANNDEKINLNLLKENTELKKELEEARSEIEKRISA